MKTLNSSIRMSWKSGHFSRSSHPIADVVFSLGLDHLLGTPALKPYLHGYFVSLKLYDAARVIANPFVYAEHREKTIRQKMEKLADSRIRARTDDLPKVNRALAERLIQSQITGNKKKRKRDEDLDEGKEIVDGENGEDKSKAPKKDKGIDLLMDPRFKAVFEDPEFEIDEASREFALLHPSQAESAKKKIKTAVDEEEEESSVGNLSSDDLGLNGESSEEESKEESSSNEDGEYLAGSRCIITQVFIDMEMVSLRPNKEQHFDNRPRSLPKMVAARAETNGSNSSNIRDPTATFGQRRHSLKSKASKYQSHGDDIIKPSEDGGMSISFTPRSSAREDRDTNQMAKKDKDRQKPGIKYLGAGLERGMERQEVSEADRKGRTQRRKGIRSGSKNAFRGL
jgi:ribosome biogenesis protein ENP2